MGIDEKSIGKVTADDITSLVENRVPESRTLEYKVQLHGKSPEEKREFLADISALANTAGGTVIFGVETKKRGDTAVPERIVGIEVADLDAEIRRLSATLRTGLTPPFTQLSWHRLTMQETRGVVVVLRVSPSLTGPHMVTYDQTREFWRRGPADKYNPDVQELRHMFLGGITYLDEVERFRRDRVDRVRAGRKANRGPDTASSVFIHVLPFGRLDRLLNLRAHESELRGFAPLSHSGWSHRFNSIGFMTYTETTSYAQWFRHGGLEGYSAWYRGPPSEVSGNFDQVYIDVLSTEVRDFARRGLRLAQDTLGLAPPFVVGIAAYGFAGAVLARPRHLVRFAFHAIDADVELLPPILVDEADAPNLEEEIDRVIDIIWQSAGYAGAP